MAVACCKILLKADESNLMNSNHKLLYSSLKSKDLAQSNCNVYLSRLTNKSNVI